MITIEKAKELCVEAHKNQWRKQKRTVRENWEQYKTLGAHIVNGNLVNWENNNLFLISEPYHIHPFAVVNMMTTKEEKITAYLHDVIEDTEATLSTKIEDDIEEYWIILNGNAYILSFNVYHALKLLTKPTKVKNYQFYIEECICQAHWLNTELKEPVNLAIKVKIADIIHNLSDNPSEKQKAKYIKALPILLNSI